MRIDKSKCKKILTEVPASCRGLITKLKTCPESELVNILKEITVWEYGKCELYHWIEVLDRFDAILERVAKPETAQPNEMMIYLCRKLEEKQSKHLVYYVLYFTALLMEHAYARHLYSSIEHLTNLLAASDMDIVLAVLNLLYVFSKRSNFISRLTPERRSSLKLRLNHLAESWGGKDNGFGLAACCEDKALSEFPPTATTLHYEFYILGSNGASSHKVIHKEHLDSYSESSARIMEDLVTTFQVPTGKQMGLLTHIRLAQAFSNYTRRLQCVQARLQAISILVYSNAGNDILQNLLYDGLIEELVDVLGVSDSRLTDIKAAALRTLTAIIHLERTPRINAIIDATGMSSYHGFFPSLFRSCVLAMIGESKETPLPQTLSTALFSFLYHLASYESGGEALVSCGIMETLLRIVQWKSLDNSQLTFVTRAVRLVDLITNMDITTFTNFSGLTCLISRLDHEVQNCREDLGEEPLLKSPTLEDIDVANEGSDKREGESSLLAVSLDNIDVAMTTDSTPQDVDMVDREQASSSKSNKSSTKSGRSMCIPQRAALLKSVLNFLKKSIPDPLFSDYIRNVMDGSLPSSLKHIISKAEYYGPSLFLLATEVVTLYVFHEPSLLSSLQDRKLTDVILEALVVKEVPPTREVIASLPNILSALCLNQRGLEAFIKCKPFDRLFHVLLSPQYLPAMRRRSSDSLGDTATNLGTAMDELMRHQPTLRHDAMTAIIKLLKEVCIMGEDENVVVQNMSLSGDLTDRADEKGDGSDEDDEVVMRRAKVSADNSPTDPTGSGISSSCSAQTKQSLPLMEYVYNVVRFIDAILSNNATDDHCKEFVKQGGLEPLIKIPSLPNIAIQFASSRACMDVAITLKDILTLSQDGTVIVQCFNQIDQLIKQLEPMYNPTAQSYLVNELARSSTPTQPYNSAKSTPLLHTITALESYTTLLISLCKVGQRNFQVDMRTVCIAKWGSDQGLAIINKLSHLYTAIVWENDLLGLLSPPYNHTQGRTDLERLIEAIGPNPVIKLKGKERKDKSPPHIRLIKPLWQAVDRLRKHLAAFLTVLCKLSCGHTRVRRTMGNKPVPSTHQCDIAKHIIKFVVNGLTWRPPNIPDIHPRVSLMAMIDHIGLAGQILYSESQQPYHLMLLEFDRAQGLQALVETYEWSASVPKQENKDLAPGSGEFMVAWLTLIKKLIDVKQVTESSHSLPSQTVPPSAQYKQFEFEPVHFLAKSHKFAFEVISQLWDELYAYSGMKTLKNEIGPLTEHVIVILKHLLKGDLQDKIQKLDKRSEEGASSSSLNDSTVQPSEHLVQQLIDMGFARRHAVEALIHSNNNMTAATEYVLSRPSLSIPMPDSDLSEEEAMMQAIAMSLAVEEEGALPPEEKQPEEPQPEIEYVTEDKLWSLYDKILAGCIKLLEDVPSAVFKIGDLLAVIMDRKGDTSRADTISRILPLVVEGVKHVIDCLNESNFTAQSNNRKIAVLGAYLHCLLLISEDLMFSCGELFSETNLFNDHLVTLLRLYTNHLVKEGSTDNKPPGWLTPLVLLFDVHEKMATMVKRRSSLPKVEHIWQYYEERHNRWVNYHASSNATIEKAYLAGEQEVCFNSGRRHYMVIFSIMTQINEENGAPRPVMRLPKPGLLPSPTEPSTSGVAEATETDSEKNSVNKKTSETGKDKFSGSGIKTDNIDSQEMQSVEHFNEAQISDIVVLCTKILGHIQDADAVQALLRLLLRFTRNHKHAQLFAENNGLHHVLHLKEGSSFTGFSSLSTLIFRHLLEDELTLKCTVENTVLGFLAGTVADESNETRTSGNIKEIHNMLQRLAPVASRAEKIFSETCQKFLRFTVPPNLKESIKSVADVNDLSSILKEPYTMRASSEKPEEYSTISPLAAMAISSLLGRLTVLYHTSEESLMKMHDRDLSELKTAPQELLTLEEPSPLPSLESVRAPKKRRKTGHSELKEKAKVPGTKKFLVTQSAILKMLSEAVKSYSGVAEFVIDQTVLNKDGESTSALTFIMDNLLAAPGKDAPPGREDTHEYAKMILSTVAASNSSEPAKEKLVDQIRMSFISALNTLESPAKHAKVQAIASLMSIILDPRGPYNLPVMVDSLNLNSFSSQTPPYVSKLLIAKGLVSDLAQVPHKLDLSSPHMALTINMCLKPLEVLTRLIYTATLSESSQASDRPEETDKQDRERTRSEVEETLGDLILNNVVDQLLDGTLPSSSAANILVSSSQEDMDSMDVISRPIPIANEGTSWSGRPDRHAEEEEEDEEEERRVADEEPAVRSSPNHATSSFIQALQGLGEPFNNQQGFSGDGDEDEEDSFSDEEDGEDDDDDDEGDDDEDEDEEEEGRLGNTPEDEDDHGVDDTVDEADANMVDEDEGSDMEVDDDDDDDDVDMELDDTSNLVFDTTRADNFNLDFLNDEEEQFVAVMNTSRLNSARTHFRWSNHSPLARARARANGATSSGLPTSHPLLMRNSEVTPAADSTNTTAAGSGTAVTSTSRIPRLLDSDTGAPFLHRLLNSGADAVLLGSSRSRNSRVHVFDQVTRDEILNSELNDFNPGGGNSETVLTLPSALSRWREEAQVLDGSSLQDLVQLIKPPIISALQGHMDNEVAVIKEARVKELNEEIAKEAEAAKKRKEAEKAEKSEVKEKVQEEAAGGESSSTTIPSETSPSDDLGPLLSSSLNMASNTASEASSGGDESVSNNEAATLPVVPVPQSSLPSVSSQGEAITEQQGQDGDDSMPEMFPDDSDSSLTSVDSSAGWTPPQSTTGPDQASTATDRASPSYSPMSESNPLLPPANPPVTSSGAAQVSDDVTSTVTSSGVDTSEAGVSSAITEVTSLVSEAIASVGDLTSRANDVISGSVPAVTSANETSAQTAPNAIYIDGIPVPEGIDPSFLEALPDSIRMEVLLEQSAALERQRRVAAQQRATEPQPSGAERTDTYNPSDVLMSLPSSLRRSVLADMEESQLNSLSEDLVQDYERIRSEQRARTVYTTIPSSAGGTSRAGGSARSLLSRLNNLVNFSYRTLNIGSSNRASIGPIFASTIPPFPPVSGLSSSGLTYKHEIKRSAQLQEEVRKVMKKKPIEHEAITCLLVLLFIDDSLRLQTSRLHRVLRNLCCNTSSRTWVLISLISIIQKCTAAKKTNKVSSKSPNSLLSSLNSQNSWLALSMNTSLGCKNNVFEVNASSKGQINSQEVIKIHPQASTVVCRRVLDLLVALGRYFPNHFLSRSVIESGLKYGGCRAADEKKVPQAELLNTGLALTDFWDFLLSSEHVKGKVPSGKTTKMTTSSHFLSCPMGQLMVLLDHPVIKNNQTLIDRLLRLLSSIAHALAEQTSDKKDEKKNKNVEPLPEDCPENSIEKQHLQLVTSILTTGACSEEGLEDGTSLLLQLSKVNSRLRDLTLSLMLSGLQSVATDLQQQIKQLLEELKEEHRRNPQKKQKEKDVTKSKALTLQPNKGSLKTPHRDLHLPAMSNLTKKNSSQAYFLRILKVVIAVRDVTIKSIEAEKEKKKKEREAKLKEEKEKKRKEREEQRKEGEETESEDEDETKTEEDDDKTGGLGPLSEQLKVSQLWSTLGECLTELGSSNDTHAVLVLQPAVEAFFHVHGIDKAAGAAARRGRNTSGSLDLLTESPAPLSVEPVDSVSSLSSGGQGALSSFTSDMCPDTRKFITFAEQHRIVLNQILRQSTTPLSDGPFQVLVNHTRVLDFDVKRRYFRQELDKIEETNRREDIAIRVRREHVFEESFRELHRRSPEELKSRLYVIFEGEEGQDAGGLLREWYQIIAREIFNPHYALFTTTPGDKVTYVCNSFSHYNPNHLDYFKFVGRVIAKAIYDNKHLDCYFSRSFYKHILGQSISFKDMEHEDYAFYKSMMFLLEHDLVEAGLDNLDFTMEIEEFGVTETRELKPNGHEIAVTNANKKEYVKLISQMKMTGSIRSQIKAFLDGFYDIIPKHLISIFSDTELELLISGLPTIDIEDLKANTEYHKFSLTSLQIQWFWRALRSFSQAERANFLQFVTGTSKVPLQGFSSLEGMNGVQKFQIHRDDRSTDRLPSAHTCFNQLDLPVYETYDKLRKNLLLAINECPEGFGLA